MFISKPVNTDKYLGIPFLHLGRSWDGADCYGLVKLFYKTEFDIVLPEYNYIKDWQDKDFNYIEKEIWSKFIKIEQPQKYCLATFKHMCGKIDGHIGIMLDDISFLHIKRNSMAMISKLTNEYCRKSFSAFWEYKNAS